MTVLHRELALRSKFLLQRCLYASYDHRIGQHLAILTISVCGARTGISLKTLLVMTPSVGHW